MKRGLSLLLAGTLSFGMLAGISASAEEKKDVTLTFDSHQSGLPTSGIVQDLAKEFEEETGIKIDFQVIPDAQWRDLLKVKLDSGEAYDIMNVDADPLSLVNRINPEKNCVDLSDQEWVSRMDPVVLPDISVGDTVYGIQFNGPRRSGFMYNKKMFADLNLEVPTTYEEFKTVCQTLLDAGITPIYEATQNGWHQVTPLFELGSYYLTKHEDLYEKLNNNEMQVSEIPELLTVIQQIKEFADLGFYGDNFLNQSVEGAKQALANGEAAMFSNDSGWATELETEYPEMKDNVGFFVCPWADNQTISCNPTCNAYFINKNSEHVEEAKAFFNFLAEHDNLQKMLDGASNLTSLCWPEIESKEKPEFAEYFGTLPQGIVMQVGVSYIDPQWMDVGKDIDAMYSGVMTPEEVFEKIDTRREEQAEIAQDPAWE